jgi:hypothetical protein
MAGLAQKSTATIPVMVGSVRDLAHGQMGYIPVEALRSGGGVGATCTVFDRPFRYASFRIEAVTAWDATLPMSVKATCVSYDDVMWVFDNPSTLYMYDGDGRRQTTLHPSAVLRDRLMPEVNHIASHPGVLLTVEEW